MATLHFESTAPSLSSADVERFSRQMMVEGIGAAGMARIRGGRVACVGAGGLGSSIALYLAAAGVGTLTLIDFDRVEVSNLHRQVIHTTAAVGQLKVDSARRACLAIYPEARVVAVPEALAPHNARRLLEHHDVILDGSDNVAARYLVNDAAMALGIPLVSGSAMRWDGQLSVYGFQGGPCYRCLFPQPPPAEAVGSCNDTGVVGPVPGLIGCLQALEALKILAGAGDVLSGRLFVFDGLRFTTRVVKLRSRQPHCLACSAAHPPSAEANLLLASRAEYVPVSCAVGAAFSHALLVDPRLCVDVTVFAEAMRDASGGACLCVDVRAPIQFEMAHLSGSHNVSLAQLQTWRSQGSLGDAWSAQLQTLMATHEAAARTGQKRAQRPGSSVCTVFLICRRGVASAQAMRLLLDTLAASGAVETPEANKEIGPAWTTADGQRTYVLRNVDGGLNAFHTHVDHSFPYY